MKTQIHLSTQINSLAVAFCFIVAPQFAQSFERTTSEKKIEGVKLTDTITLSELGIAPLKSVAQGLRKKKVAFMNFKVYIGEILLPTDVTWDGQRETFEKAPQAGTILTFLRDVSSSDVTDTFKEGLKANGVDIKAPEIKSFLNAAKKIGDVDEGESLILARVQKKDGDQALIFIPGREPIILPGPPGWTTHILKIFSGKPTDSGIRDLQKAFFK